MSNIYDLAKARLLTTLLLAIITGCASTYEQTDVKPVSVKLDASKSVLVSVPPNGWFEQIEYQGSGRMTANAVTVAFAAHSPSVDLTDTCHGDDCFAQATEGGYGYYARPEVLHWEERATEWSGRPDVIEIQLRVFDVPSGTELANSTYTGKSKWMTMGGDRPQDLLPEPTQAYVDSLYE